jgi:uncharacterized membrane protein
MLASASVLLIFLGLAIDTAYLHLVKTRMQLAADAASIGGALEYKAAGGSVQVRVSRTPFPRSARSGRVRSRCKVTPGS